MDALFEPSPSQSLTESDEQLSIDNRSVKRRLSDVSSSPPTSQEQCSSFDPNWANQMLVQLGISNLRLEEDRCQRAREENVVIKALDSHAFIRGMSHSLSQYERMGQAAKEESIPYAGHPWGKKPNALFRALLFRFYSVLQDAFAAYQDSSQDVVQAWQIIKQAAQLAHAGDSSVMSTRCFKVALKEGADAGSTKWIFASSRMPHVIAAFRVLQQGKIFESAGVCIENDTAPRSNTSKKIHALMFGSGKGGKSAGKGKAKTKRK